MKLFLTLGTACLSAGALAQTVSIDCATPLASLDSQPGAWSISGPYAQPDRTTPPPATPPAGVYQPAVAAPPIDVPAPADPPIDLDGYRWDAARGLTWLSVNASGNTQPQLNSHYYFRQQITLDPAVDASQFSLSYDVSVDDELWAVWVNGVPQAIGTVPFAGFGPADAATRYRDSRYLPVTLASGWQTGATEVVFAVMDFGGYTGLASQATGANRVCPTAPPPVATVAPVPVNDWRGLLGLGMLLAGMSAWRIRRHARRSAA
jgi:hypothetical protein